MELRSKIIELFKYRQLPELIAVGNEGPDGDFYERLIQLQVDIYLLDDVLESNWDIDPELLQKKWDGIYLSLARLGVEKTSYDAYCDYIYQYQTHELELRDDLMPTRHDMEYFYYYKSCDVKLIRRLIYEKYPVLNTIVPLEGWKLFDLVTEVNDDVEDIYEDCGTINANSFLISTLEKGRKATQTVFTKFLNSISRENEIEGLGQFNLQEITEEHIQITKDLLISNLSNISHSQLSECRLLRYSKIL